MTTRSPAKKYEFHPLFDFPLIEGDELDKLVVDLQTKGLDEERGFEGRTWEHQLAGIPATYPLGPNAADRC